MKPYSELIVTEEELAAGDVDPVELLTTAKNVVLVRNNGERLKLRIEQLGISLAPDDMDISYSASRGTDVEDQSDPAPNYMKS